MVATSALPSTTCTSDDRYDCDGSRRLQMPATVLIHTLSSELRCGRLQTCSSSLQTLKSSLCFQLLARGWNPPAKSPGYALM